MLSNNEEKLRVNRGGQAPAMEAGGAVRIGGLQVMVAGGAVGIGGFSSSKLRVTDDVTEGEKWLQLS